MRSGTSSGEPIEQQLRDEEVRKLARDVLVAIAAPGRAPSAIVGDVRVAYDYATAFVDETVRRARASSPPIDPASIE